MGSSPYRPTRPLPQAVLSKTAIQYRNAVVDIHHVGRFHKGVVKIFVGRVQRVINLETSAAFSQGIGDSNAAIEISRVAAGPARRGSVPSGSGGFLAVSYGVILCQA